MAEERILNFIEEKVESDLASGRVRSVVTRFPPEPNGYLHVGHAKAFCIDFGIAEKYGGVCNLRFDDTNPSKEDTEYVNAIQEDIRWLGFHWARLTYASDFFDQMYACAEKLILNGDAYVCSLTPEEMRLYRGTLTEKGTPSPRRDTSPEENLALFRRMKAGEFADGAYVLRAKIDMDSPNMNMRDPVIYRILHARHHRTGDKWCIYPMYDFAHPLEDAFEGVTHSLCSLEFEDHRPLYDWVIAHCGPFDPAPQQTEFARFNLTRTLMSKRYLRALVEKGVVDGWDDPRMPTLTAMRRRGYPPEAIREFMTRVGVAKSVSTVDYAMLEFCVREWLKPRATRLMCVADPIRLVLTNYPADKRETVKLENNGDDETAGVRDVTFSRELYIEREDFMIDAPSKYFRLKPGGEVRLKGAYIVKCTGWHVGEDGRVDEVYAEYDPTSLSGMEGAARKVKGTLHWVSAADAVPCRIRLYDFLLKADDDDTLDITERVNPDSLTVKNGFIERAGGALPVGTRLQFIRNGYFCVDKDSTEELPVFNRIVGLKDTWAKISK
ncbi:MAG: glutamine--tRNA ligase/YqeY domain fusion protein [Eubacteriales bacterium]|nr:glutamine--tRNA ligase/YqeY domain fusion protein [Eubacteriales bacterium]